jgi:four helix bundle protein
MITGYKDLRIWQTGIQIVKEVYILSNCFPKHELYGLSGQMRRAAISIPSNIAEGFCRLHRKEYKQFLSVSLGSCAELTTQVYIAIELNYINREKAESLIKIIEQESKQIRALISKINSEC